MLKFRPSVNLTQKRANITFNEVQLIALIEKALSDNSLRGFLYKRSSPTAKWRLKWFLLFENLLFYFDLGSNHPPQAAANQQQQQQSPSKSSTFSSLIRRQNKQQQQQQGNPPDEGWRSSRSSRQLTEGPFEQASRRASVSASPFDWRPLSLRDSSTKRQQQQQITQRQLEERVASGRPVSATSSVIESGPSSSLSRQRLCSEPQNLLAGGTQESNESLCFSGSQQNNATTTTTTTGGPATAVITPIQRQLNQQQQAATCQRKTINSSSISGVSNHFLAHNEQTIGRSTTTTAGKTASSSFANYSSLLSRKIGVIFLEGSYCEQLADSESSFAATANQQIAKGRPHLTQADLELFGGALSSGAGAKSSCKPDEEDTELDCIFTLTWRKEGSKNYQFRSETKAECQTWVHAIGSARYSSLVNDKEQLEQKYLHLSQIIESESTAKWQYSRQCEEFSAEIKKLRQEICLLRRQENRSSHLKLVLAKSAAIVETIMRQQRRRRHDLQQQQCGQYQRHEQAPGNAAPVSEAEEDELEFGSDQVLDNGAGQVSARGERGQIVYNDQPETNEDLASASQRLMLILANRNCPISQQQQQQPSPAADSPTSRPLVRRFNKALSMEQEQAEQELAVRRTGRRCNRFRSARTSANFTSVELSGKAGVRNGECPAAASCQSAPLNEEEPLEASLGRSGGRITAGGGALGRSPTESPLNKAKRFRSMEVFEQDRRSLCGSSPSPSLPPQPQPQPPLNAPKLAYHYTSGSKPRKETIRQAANGETRAKLEAAEADLAASEADEQARLSAELKTVVEALNNGILLSDCLLEVESSEEIRKIKKVQGFFRGWLCRRRWKQIVQEYIKSPHAESMRKRNNLVFRMVECEEEYVEQLALLISAFLRPIKMAASSQQPALSHDELNSIFLNAETLLFLHQIFLKGLTARMESWPTLVLGDLFNMLLPMLTIYQEFVRNHHFSLQVLAECKQREQFSLILRRLEEKPQLNGRTLETFLTYPMHQIPRYIICLHEILAHTPHNHVERKSLYEAQTKLEDLSRQMHDEVSETENIRQNLAIERMIIGGCDILLDVNQVFVRQGILIQVDQSAPKSGKSRSRLASFAARQVNRPQPDGGHAQLTQTNSATYSHQNCNNQTKEMIRQCFLFTNHLLLCTRTKDGKLHLLENIGRIPLTELTLIENPLEFIQQQETIIANFESIAQSVPGQQWPLQRQKLQQQPDGANSGQTDNKGNVNQQQQQQQQQQANRQGTNAKLLNNADRTANGPQTRAEFERDCGPEQVRNSGESNESAPSTLSSVAAAAKQSSGGGGGGGSSRSRIAGYLATKLSNLTNLTGSANAANGQQQQQQTQSSSSSAPPSPLNKRQPQQATNSQVNNYYSYGSNSSPSTKRHSNSSLAHGNKRNSNEPVPALFQLSKDYAGCDFILFLESSSKLNPTAKLGLSAGGTPSHSHAAAGQGQGSHQASANHLSAFANNNGPLIIHLVAPNLQEKAAWMSDISQCIDNVHFNDIFHGSVNDSSSVTINHSVRTDPRLYKDDIDIKFSRALNSCKLPQIRYASKERLFERLTDLRFLSIDFLNTFLLTYRVFTTAEDVLEALKSVHYNSDRYYQQQQMIGEGRDSISVSADANGAGPTQSYSTQSTSTGQVRLDQQQDGADHLNKSTDLTPNTTAVASNVTQLANAAAVVVVEDERQVSSTPSLESPQPRATQKPQVPPRSPGTNLTGAKPSAQANDKTNYLSAPDTRHQKRRSTISTLTPITGSNSSSLANLNNLFKGSAQPSSKVLKQANKIQPGELVGANLSGCVFLDESSPSHCSNNGELSFAFSEEDETLKSTSVSPIVPDRLRSSSMTTNKPLLMVDEYGSFKSKTNLEIPNSRQVRASSFSHVPNAPLLNATLRNSNLNNNSSSGNEHWRLSYKKAAKKESNLSPNLDNPTENQKDYLSPTGRNAVSTRRASSLDMSVTFHVTLEPPPPEPGGAKDSEDETNNLITIVPPSTPIEQPSEIAELEVFVPVSLSNCDSRSELTDQSDESALKKVHKSKRTGRDRLESPNNKTGHDERISRASRQSKRESPSNCSSSSNSSLVNSSSSSSMSSTKSVLSSRPEFGLIQSSSSFDSLNHGNEHCKDPFTNGLEVPAINKKRHNKNRALKRARKAKAIKFVKQMSRNFSVKEIELTESKLFDCDTSADEDQVSASSGDGEMIENNNSSSASNLSNISGKFGDDDSSLRILTKLNSLHLNNNDESDNQDHINSCPEMEKSALIKSKDEKGGARLSPGDSVAGVVGNKVSEVVVRENPANVIEHEQFERLKTSKQGGNQIIPHNKSVPKAEKVAPRSVGLSFQASSAQVKNEPLPRSTQQNSADDVTSIKPAEPQQATASILVGRHSISQSPSGTRECILTRSEQRNWVSTLTLSQQSVTGGGSSMITPRSSFQHYPADTCAENISKAGVIVSSSAPRVTSRRSSTASAASAFAAATAASNNPILTQPPPFLNQPVAGNQFPPINHQRKLSSHTIDSNSQHECLCLSLNHRASISSQPAHVQFQLRGQPPLPQQQQQQLQRGLLSSARGQPAQQVLTHHPSCIYSTQQVGSTGSPSNTPSASYQNYPHSDASSLCNSRASSRLSSSAGLDYGGSYSSQVNFYSTSQHQQFAGTYNQSATPTQQNTPQRVYPMQQNSNQRANVGGNQPIIGQTGNRMVAPISKTPKRHSTQINFRSVATIRVLSVLRHWVSKHSQDFVNDTKLSYLVQEFLQDLIVDTNLLPAEHKAALQLQQMVQKAAHLRGTQVDLDLLLAPPTKPSPDSIETLSALEIAEGMAYLDHKIFLAIRSEEFLGQAWMKMDKAIKAPHILLITKRFNDVSRLVSSEIIRVAELHRRVAIIEKWTNVAHICRVVHNFNGVLQICAAFTNSAVFRLKKTWDNIPKTTKTTIDQLQSLVSTDSRFRNMRDAINRCDPPSIPYVGMYLTDLSFIEEGTPNYSPDGLLNFSKMRMIAHVIREIQHLQNGSYKIELNHKVANYLLDDSRHLQDDEMYKCSLAIEPRSTGGKNGVQLMNSASATQHNGTTPKSKGSDQVNPF